MKSDELIDEPEEDEEEFDEESELLETQNNLTEALNVVEDCHAILTAILNPTAIHAYLDRELRRVGQEAESLLQQYDYPMLTLEDSANTEGEGK